MNSLICLCEKGGTEYSLFEIKEILGVEGKQINDFLVNVNIRDIDDACKLIYLNQSLQRVVLLLDKGEFKDLEDLINKIKNIKFESINNILEKILTIKLESHRFGKHDFNSMDVESQGIGVMNARLKKKIDLKNPELIFAIIINENNYYFGIDLAGKDLSKREYRVFVANDALKGTIAYDFMRFIVGEKVKEKVKDNVNILDLFPRSGEIILETAFFLSGFSLNYFKKKDFSFTKFIDFDFESIDKKAKMKKLNLYAFDNDFRHISMIQKNSKIGGVQDLINCSRQDLRYAFMKFHDNELDFIITYFPYKHKYDKDEKYSKLVRNFFEESDRMLSKNGKIGIITKQPELIVLDNTNFEIEEKKDIWQGKTVLTMLKIKRK